MLTTEMYFPSFVALNWQREEKPPMGLHPGTFHPATLSMLGRRHTNMRPSADLVAKRSPGKKRCSKVAQLEGNLKVLYRGKAI